MLTISLGCKRLISLHTSARGSATISIGGLYKNWRGLIAYDRMMSDYEVTLVNDNSKQLAKSSQISKIPLY